MHRKRVIALLLISFLLCGCSPQSPSQTPTFLKEIIAKATQAEPVAFPLNLGNNSLVAEKVVCYQGAYWEDGSGEYVENVAGLMLYNPTDRMIEFAAFALEQENTTLYFFVHYLPPDSRCLVLEKNRRSCNPEQITQCRELNIRWSRQELSREQIDYVGVGEDMTIVNRDPRMLDHVVVRYKRYLPREDYYLGGMVFSVHLLNLTTEERRTVRPEHYKTTDARIVGIEIKN